MKKNVKKILLGGALLALLLLCLSYVAATDIANETQVVNNSSITNNTIENKHIPDFDNLTNNDVANQTKVNKESKPISKNDYCDFKTNKIIIKNNKDHVSLKNIVCDTLIIEDSDISYIRIYNSNIKKVIIKHTIVRSMFYRSYIVGTTIGSLIIEDSNLKDQLEIKYSNIWNITLIDSYLDYIHVSDRSNLVFNHSLNSHIKKVVVDVYSKVVFESTTLNSVHELTHDDHSFVITWCPSKFF